MTHTDAPLHPRPTEAQVAESVRGWIEMARTYARQFMSDEKAAAMVRREAEEIGRE